MHQGLVRNVAIGKNNNVDFLFRDQSFEVTFLNNRYPRWIAFAGEFGGIAPVGNVGNLGCCESDHFVVVISAEEYVEIMRVTAGSTEDGNSLHETVTLTPHLRSRILYALAGNGRKAVRRVTGRGESCRRIVTRTVRSIPEMGIAVPQLPNVQAAT